MLEEEMASDNASSHTHSQAPTVNINSPFVFNSLLVLPSSPAPLSDPLVDISLAASDEISYSIVATSSNSSDMAQKDMEYLVAHAVGFWDCRLFINAATEYQPLDFGTAGDKFQGIKEVSAFLGHVQAWNYSYGQTGELGGVESGPSYCHPEYLENNATLAFQAAISRWMASAAFLPWF
ncbi:unnamed protein product [Brassica rapa]|uniref:Uncharacterized protein n=1 Tax=Brassica campestris TaxID=3711 RepID=A0A8D9DKH7_BRACM|nr:unnamed protein product [Brassica rapa]